MFTCFFLNVKFVKQYAEVCQTRWSQQCKHVCRSLPNTLEAAM